MPDDTPAHEPATQLEADPIDTARSWRTINVVKGRAYARVSRRSGLAPTAQAARRAAAGELGRAGLADVASKRFSTKVALGLGRADQLPAGFWEAFLPAFDAAVRAGLITVTTAPNGSPTLNTPENKRLCRELRDLASNHVLSRAAGIRETALDRRVAGFAEPPAAAAVLVGEFAEAPFG